MNYKKLQLQYDKIYAYFKKTTEPFDDLEWDGKMLNIWLDGLIIESYQYKYLQKCIFN